MLSKAIALRKESMSPYTLPPMEESEITQPSVSCPGSRTKLEPLSSPLGSPKQLSSPKPVVAECENCKKKFYSRYPTSMHISSCCSKDCYTSYSWNLKKPSHYQLQEAEAAHWRAVHASNQDLSLLEEEQGQKEKNDEADQQALLELFHSTQQLSKEPTFTTINSNSTSESFDNADSFYSIRSMRSPTNRVLLEPLTPANLEALCERKITDDSDRPRTHMTTPPSETTIKLQNRPFNPQSLAFRSDSPSVNSKIPAEQSSYSGHFERSTASVRMAPIKSVKRDLPADTSTKSDGGYFRKLLSKFV